MILLNPEEKANYIASLEESGSNDGMLEWGGTGLEEVKQPERRNTDLTHWKVKMGQKVKAVACPDFVTFQTNIAESFGIDPQSFEITVIDDQPQDAILIESQADLVETIALLGDPRKHIANLRLSN